MYSTKTFVILLSCFIAAASAHAQQKTSFVNPFTGTEKSDVFTRWGSEGGTYPGAVAPSGYIQLTPETSIQEPKGYYYNDSAIYFFSCLNHKSGFPAGSSGQLYVMPVTEPEKFRFGKTKRTFHHTDESATPGYYSVSFPDNKTSVEATTSTRGGIFRFTFARGTIPAIFIGGAGNIENISNKTLYGAKHHSVFIFDQAYSKVLLNDSGSIYIFKPAAAGATTIILKLSASAVGKTSTERNIEAELKGKSFEYIRQQTNAEWNRLLSVVDIEDSSYRNKSIFYTALYHSLLVPWIISDADGKYMGRDKKVYTATGKDEYAGFSPWDTFRSLHPLLTFLFPGKQRDMVLSLLDFYKQTGNLPTETMTGNHAIAIIVDAYLKGITTKDSLLVYDALKSNIFTGPFRKKDMNTYISEGYVPFTWPESVTRTTEYAYNEWCIGQYAQKVLRNEKDFRYFNGRSYNYRNVFNSGSLFMLPRNKDEFKLDPGNTGYKEGDKWIYTYFVPHQPQDLINILGGEAYFAKRLDSALSNNLIAFDNETVFHVPYFFNYASHPWLTQKWVNNILQNRFNNTPGGLPGNDDLGSVSSWYVFSALGLYPFCPGNPGYTIGSPVFDAATVQLSNGKKLVIRKNGRGAYVKQLYFNQAVSSQTTIPHENLAAGGELVFEMSANPVEDAFTFNTADSSRPAFSAIKYNLSKSRVLPNEPVQMYFTLRNDGAAGTKVILLTVNGKPYAQKYAMIGHGEEIRDSIPFRLYAYGSRMVGIDSLQPLEIEVINDGRPDTMAAIGHLVLEPVLFPGERQLLQYSAKNQGGATQRFRIPVQLNGKTVLTDTVTLLPGEEKSVQSVIISPFTGMQSIHIGEMKAGFKVAASKVSSSILDLSFKNTGNTSIPDASGFGNDATIAGECHIADSLPLLGNNCTVEVQPSPSLNQLKESITMMAWVFTTGGDRKKADLLARGDHHVIQITRNRTVKFFAGGWARGECDAKLPVDWKNKWHHVAGTCDGQVLKVYIDGVLQTTTPLNSKADLSAAGVWNIGSNEEFPSERNFEGYIDKVKIFAAALTEEDIKVIMKQ
ncbi:MAG: GH92 family glycosyl hydrolase [Chitinophagaceae bacterium]|nr:GH92 family glycosyl hydrolase [Chitinophagaceae bacterium]